MFPLLHIYDEHFYLIGSALVLGLAQMENNIVVGEIRIMCVNLHFQMDINDLEIQLLFFTIKTN